MLLTPLAPVATHLGCHCVVTLSLCDLGLPLLQTDTGTSPSSHPSLCHQVRLTEDLASSMAQLSHLQLEATAHQQEAMGLQSKLSSALQDSERHCQRIAALETQLEGLCCCFYWFNITVL